MSQFEESERDWIKYRDQQIKRKFCVIFSKFVRVFYKN